jgi:hypothetical protein
MLALTVAADDKFKELPRQTKIISEFAIVIGPAGPAGSPHVPFTAHLALLFKSASTMVEDALTYTVNASACPLANKAKPQAIDLIKVKRGGVTR